MKNIIWGVVLVALGVILGGNAAGIFNIDVFFNGWWTLFIIVPCLAGLITEKGHRVGNLIGLFVGVMLLLACQNIVSFSVLWKMIVPTIIIIIGFSLIFKNVFNRKLNEEISKLRENLNSDDELTAAFAGQNIDMSGEKFQGKKISAVFGGLKLDLRKAIIKEDVVVDATAIFGGIDILVPENVIVKVQSTALFGGVKSRHEGKEGFVVYVKGTAIFGGIEVK